jgi:hypothetical protein
MHGVARSGQHDRVDSMRFAGGSPPCRGQSRQVYAGTARTRTAQRKKSPPSRGQSRQVYAGAWPRAGSKPTARTRTAQRKETPPSRGQSRQVYAGAWPRAGSKPGSGSHEIYLEERYACMRAQGDPLLMRRWESEFMDASSIRTTRQIDYVRDAQALADFAQLRASGCEESAQQSALAELLQPVYVSTVVSSRPICGLCLQK